MSVAKFEFKFVETVPEKMEAGLLYVALKFNTMIHLCACGCGNEVVTPLSPKDWSFNYNGKSISISPSIGNWSFPCRSHYFIRRNGVDWASDWTDEQVQSGRELDLLRKRGKTEPESGPLLTSNNPTHVKPGFIKRIFNRIFKTSEDK